MAISRNYPHVILSKDPQNPLLMPIDLLGPRRVENLPYCSCLREGAYLLAPLFVGHVQECKVCDAVEITLHNISSLLDHCRQEQTDLAGDVNTALQDIWREEAAHCCFGKAFPASFSCSWGLGCRVEP